MGSFNIACSITQKQIEPKDKVVAMISAGFSLPFFGEYADYGKLKLDKDIKNVYAILHLRNMFLKESLVKKDYKPYAFSETEDFKRFKKNKKRLEKSLSDKEKEKLIKEEVDFVLNSLDCDYLCSPKEKDWSSRDAEILFTFFEKLVELDLKVDQNDNFTQGGNFTKGEYLKIEDCFNTILECFKMLEDKGVLNHKQYYWHTHLQPQVVLRSVYENVIDYQDKGWEKTVLRSLGLIFLRLENVEKFRESKKGNFDDVFEENFVKYEFIKDTNLATKFNNDLKNYLFKDNFTFKKVIGLLKKLGEKPYFGQDDISLEYLAYANKADYEKLIADNDFIELKALFLANFVVRHYCFVYNLDAFSTNVAPITYTHEYAEPIDQFHKHLMLNVYEKKSKRPKKHKANV